MAVLKSQLQHVGQKLYLLNDWRVYTRGLKIHEGGYI